MDFRKWLELQEMYHGEKPVIDRLAGSDFDDQAEIDKGLHKGAVGKGRFGAGGDDFLAKDTRIKDDFQQIVKSVEKGVMPPLPLIQNTIRGLVYDLDVHARYLGQPENPNTGSHHWHKTWMDTYHGWLNYLKGLAAHISSSDGMK
jgi:hypothetical protein